MNARSITLADEAATAALGRALAERLRASDSGLTVYLSGELGAGKTALARAAIQRLGHAGAVVSPSYTLVEPYVVAGRRLYHLDLYRIADPEELEFIGLRDIDFERDWVWVEWAERGTGVLPAADIAIELAYAGAARQARITARSERGVAFAQGLSIPT